MNKEQDKAIAEEKKKIQQAKEEFDKEMAEIKSERENLKREQDKLLEEEKKVQQTVSDKLSVTRSIKKNDINILKPVMARLKQRYKEMQVISRAKNEKVMRGNTPHWITTPPKLHVSRLRSSMSNGVGIVSYYVYKMDEKGNKLEHEHFVDRELPDGTTMKKLHSITYDFDKFVVETIAHLKPIVVEEFIE